MWDYSVGKRLTDDVMYVEKPRDNATKTKRK